MTRKIALVLLAILVQVGVVAGVSGSAWAVPAPLVGTTNCATFKGTGTFGPKLTAAGTGTAVKITFTGNATGCAGVAKRNNAGPNVPIIKGYVTGSGYFTGPPTAARCAKFEGPPPAAGPADRIGKITMTVMWRVVGPAVQNSKVTYNAGKYNDPTFAASMNLGIGRPLTPTVVGAGSFAGSLIQHTIMDIVTPPLTNCPVGPAFVFNGGKLRF